MATQNLALKDSSALAELNKKMAVLKERADKLEKIETPAAIGTAKVLEADLKAYFKAVEFQTQPDIVAKKEELRLLQTNEAELLKPAEDILDPLTKRRKAAEMEERRKAEAEAERLRTEAANRQREKAEQEQREANERAIKVREDRVEEIRGMLRRGEIGKRESARLLKLAGANEEAAKADAAAAAEELKNAPPPKIEVKANIPTVAGTKSQVNWKWKFKPDGEFQLLEAFRKDETRRLYIQANQKAIGETVRAVKDKAKAEALIPGVEVRSE
jgi:hypothetical protein